MTPEIKNLLQRANQDHNFKNWEAALLANGQIQTKTKNHTNLSGISQVQKAYLLAALVANLEDKGANSSFCLIVSDELQLRQMQSYLQVFIDDLLVLRPREIDLAGADAGSREIEQLRIDVLTKLGRGEVCHLLVSAPALLQVLPPVEDLTQAGIELSLDCQLNLETLDAHLKASGYEKVNKVETSGQYARRGDIIDIAPVNWRQEYEDLGIRLSFFDDEIDLFAQFSLDNQRTVRTEIKSVYVAPAKEIRLPDDPEFVKDLVQKIEKYGHQALVKMRSEGIDAKHIDHLEKVWQKDLTSFAQNLAMAPIDRWLNYILPTTTTLADYWARVSAQLPIFIDEPLRVNQILDVNQAAFEERITHGILAGRNFPIAAKAQISRRECLANLNKNFAMASLAIIAGSGNGLPNADSFAIRGMESDSFRGHELELARQIKAEPLLHTFLCANTPNRQNKLRELLDSEDVAPQNYTILEIDLPRGFTYPGINTFILGVEEIFGGVAGRKRKQKNKGLSIDLFSDLKPNDMVVHDVHGIGVYKGLVNVETNGVHRDYLHLAYDKGDSLYLPMEALNQLQKYIGAGEQKQPKLSRLGGNDWDKLKTKARESVKKLATDLVKLYAKRRMIKGIIFPADTVWDQEFADAFPYVETDDQLRCISEVKSDMESSKVMDRLLCGDVGFGKTEVAFRALFKAVMGGYQAALLAPTTVLAQQHYENLRQRLADFPIRVGLLSRFAPEALQKQTLRGMSTGEVDIVVGTHRILSKDIYFKKLGLLIIDEEQRFGVDHKEKLKEVYQGVDVLTLSATPIPRTLHMSLAGIRDISVIEEAPLDRRAVQTYVLEYDQALINDAIMRELSRRGQVFYLFNNTHKIAAKVLELQEALPGVHIGFAHGKMSERQLEQVIMDFIDGQIDVLVCTTIIESGIDMPNVNTLIVENADRLGLAQLYQLRGRVGRSGRQAYAYIMYEREKVLTEVATKRLAAIRDFTELGAGFKIAMRDLEVRGAGNLLGGEQHGQMAAIGYDMYCRMLDEEIKAISAEMGIDTMHQTAADKAVVRRVNGSRTDLDRETQAQSHFSINSATATVPSESGLNLTGTVNRSQSVQPKPKITKIDTLVDLPIDAYLSREFISDEGERMDMYRRLTRIDGSVEYYDVLDELTDRYGDLPVEVQTLADISYIRHIAGWAGIEQISWQGTSVMFKLTSGPNFNIEAITLLMSKAKYQGEMNFNAGSKPYIQYIVGKTTVSEVVTTLRQLFLSIDQG